MGLNNIELITDRPLDVNFREIAEVKKRYPKHAVVVSLMVETREEWHDILKRSEDTGADGLELNFGCPHGMCERGMGSAVGQEPKVLAGARELGDGLDAASRDRQAHAERHRHPRARDGGAAGRGATRSR